MQTRRFESIKRVRIPEGIKTGWGEAIFIMRRELWANENKGRKLDLEFKKDQRLRIRPPLSE
jgi:hypothetical protein